MTFPISPDPSEIDHRGLFLVQDPEICAKLLPLFSFDPLNPEMRPVGHGTAFRIDPWSRCLTAYHVLEHMFELNDSGDGVRLRPDARILALEVNGLIYGTVGLGPEAWRPLAESYALIDIVNQPLQAPQLRNQTELAVIRVHASNPAPEGTPFLHLDFRRWIPTVGEQILAFGFAELDSESDDPNRPINQRVYGSFGHITDIECADGQRGRPWPIMRVEADWPGGMSGGPVFNQEGHVIGLVSTSIAGQVGAATFFAGWDIPQRLMGSIDPGNPGWFFCHGVFDGSNNLVRAFQDLSCANSFAERNSFADIGAVSIEPISEQWMRI